MSVQTALQFIDRARGDQAIQQTITALGDEITLDHIVQVAAAAGFTFTAAELQQAHKFEWGMRWARYSPRGGSS